MRHPRCEFCGLKATYKDEAVARCERHLPRGVGPLPATVIAAKDAEIARLRKALEDALSWLDNEIDYEAAVAHALDIVRDALSSGEARPGPGPARSG